MNNITGYNDTHFIDSSVSDRESGPSPLHFWFPPRRKSLGEIQSDALLGTADVGFQDILHDWAILHQWIIGSIPLLLHLQNSKCWHIFMPCLWWDLQRLDWCEENKAINLGNKAGNSASLATILLLTPKCMVRAFPIGAIQHIFAELPEVFPIQ